MREIKFRQPVFRRGKRKGEFSHWHYWGFTSKCVFVGPYSFAIPSFQFIGLHDKNKKEMFEEDIIQVGDIGKAKIVFGCFPIGTDDWDISHKTQGFVAEWDDRSGYMGLDDSKEDIEIIGNTLENPDLLDLEGGKK